MIIKNGFGKISEQEMINKVYSNLMNKTINFVYDTIRYRNGKPPLEDDYVWFE